MAEVSAPPMDDLRILITLWLDELPYRHAADTVRSYRSSCKTFVDFLEGHGHPLSTEQVTPRDIRQFLASVRAAGRKPGTVTKHYNVIDQLFKYAVGEEWITVSPFATLTAPPAPLQPVPIVSRDPLMKLLAACRGKSFLDRRDTAIVIFLLDTGCRASELIGLRLSDIDLVQRRIEVTGKGGRVRHIAPGSRNIRAVALYLRARSTHKLAGKTDRLWIGRRGPLTVSGLAKLLSTRCAAAGIDHVHPHQFRHTFAHNWMDANLGETNLMYLAGWRSREMLSRYAQSTAGERARHAQLTHSPADDILR